MSKTTKRGVRRQPRPGVPSSELEGRQMYGLKLADTLHAFAEILHQAAYAIDGMAPTYGDQKRRRLL